MMQTFTLPDPVNGETLRAELAAAGVTVSGLPQIDGGDLLLDVAEADRATVEQVLAAHTGDPSPHVANESTVRSRADAALDDLRAIANSSGNLSNAQLSHAVRVLARVCIALVRLVLRRLDGTD